MPLVVAASRLMSACATLTSLTTLSSHFISWVMPGSSLDPSVAIPKVLTLLSSWASSVSFSTSGNEVPSHGVAGSGVTACLGEGTCYSWYAYYSYYFHYVDQAPASNELTCSSSSWALPGGWSVRNVGLLLVATWLIAFGMALISMNLRTVWHSLCNRLRSIAHCIRCFGAGVQADTMDICRATLFLACEIMLVISRRAPIGKVTLRRTALRLRPYASAAVRDIDSDAVLTPQRRSLRAIQLEQGGCTRRMGRVRLACARHRTLRISCRSTSADSYRPTADGLD
eukprot:4083786-Amphidinium_carterae.1